MYVNRPNPHAVRPASASTSASFSGTRAKQNRYELKGNVQNEIKHSVDQLELSHGEKQSQKLQTANIDAYVGTRGEEPAIISNAMPKPKGIFRFNAKITGDKKNKKYKNLVFFPNSRTFSVKSRGRDFETTLKENQEAFRASAALDLRGINGDSINPCNSPRRNQGSNIEYSPPKNAEFDSFGNPNISPRPPHSAPSSARVHRGVRNVQ